jgi:hypothetical protein
MRTTMTAGILGAMIAVLGADVAEAGTVTFRTTSLVPDPDGSVYCQVDARGRRPIDIVAHVVTTNGANVTEFGTGFRASPEATGDGSYYAEETAGSLNDGARACIVTVKGARRGKIHVSFTAYDGSGNPVVTVQGE